MVNVKNAYAGQFSPLLTCAIPAKSMELGFGPNVQERKVLAPGELVSTEDLIQPHDNICKREVSS